MKISLLIQSAALPLRAVSSVAREEKNNYDNVVSLGL